jgi:hypothetical protein
LAPTRLDSLQQEVLAAFFRREERFFLTGGAALAGFHLGHRTTKDLDLFTTQDRLEKGVSALTAVAAEIGASMEALQTAPDFRRFLLRRGSGAVVVDLVHDLAPQIFRDKLLIGGIRVDPPEEILANKLCALLSRAEIRDLVDVWALEKSGFSLERGLEQAAQKDGGMTPGQLAWVLSQVRIGEDADPPGVSAEELRRYLNDLRSRLAGLSFPGPS